MSDVHRALGRHITRMPAVFESEIYQSVGRYARGAVLYAFQEIGGAPSLAEWAEDNKELFYTRLFPKIIARESEVTHHRTVDQLMDVLDAGLPEVEDAEVLQEEYRPLVNNWAGRAAPIEDAGDAEEVRVFDGADMVEFDE